MVTSYLFPMISLAMTIALGARVFVPRALALASPGQDIDGEIMHRQLIRHRYFSIKTANT